MKQKDRDDTRAATLLRAHAEEVLARGEHAALEDLSHGDLKEIVHELRIHQIELELQNQELRQTQQRLADEHNRYIDLYDTAPVGYITLNDDGRILRANLTIAALMGTPREVLIGQPWSRFVAPASQDTCHLYLQQLRKTGSLQGCEIQLVQQEERPFWAMLKGQRASNTAGCPNGERVCYRITINDITARREAEETLKASEARYRALAEENAQLLAQARRDSKVKANLLQEVNHRVTNNMTALLAILNIERRYASQKGLDTVAMALEGLTGRVRGMAAAHRLLSQSEWAPVRLCKLAREAIGGALNALPWDRASEVRVYITPSPIRVPSKHAHTLALMFNELATNTIKYGLRSHNQGQINVRIGQEDDWIDLVYQDDGPGYPQPVLQGEQHDVGLYLLERLTKDMEGYIALENKEGAVTRMHIPLQRQDADLRG